MKHPFISSTYNYTVQYDMTPAMAAYLLANFNKNNPRPLDKQEAHSRLADAIKQGQWDSRCGDPIKFAANGDILDGQTRLEAIINAGMTVQVDIAYGIPASASPNIGTSRPFSLGVTMARILGEGHNQVINLVKAGAVARLWMRFELQNSSARLSRQQITNFYVLHRSQIDAVLAPVANQSIRAGRAGLRAAIAFYSTKNPAKAKALFEDVTGNGANIKPESPAYHLRNYFTKEVKYHPQKQLQFDFEHALSMCWEVEQGNKVQAISQRSKWGN